eukprot:20374-Heterococcus_DN1.PRE.3
MIAMRHVRLLCLLLIAKLTVCNALLPAPMFSSQLAAHVCSSYSSGAMKRMAVVMAAAPNASEPVRITPDKPMRQPSRQCTHPGCTIYASYGYEYDRKLIRCVTHIEAGMRCLTSKQCEEPNCRTRALFGKPDTKVSDT